MKQIICALALSSILLLPLPLLAETQSPATPAQAEAETVHLRTSKQVNLRKLPDKKSDLVESLKKHSIVTVLSEFDQNDENWLFVETKNGRKGYLLESLMEPVPTPSPVPTATPTPEPTAIPTPKPSDAPDATPTPKAEKDEVLYEEPRIVRTLTRANLRRKPDGRRIAELPENMQLSALGEVEKDGKLWLHLDKGAKNKEGYMLAEFLRQVRPVELRPVSEGEVRSLYPTLSRDPIADIKAEIPFTYTEEELSAYHTLRPGDKSKHVLNLRKRLYELGYYEKPNENMLYTESTADVVRVFQRDCGVEPTGEADPLTQALLFDTRMPAREGSPQEVTYLSNKLQPLYIQRAEVTQYSFFGSVQVSVRNNSNGKLTAFGLKIIPNMSDGSLADLRETFAEEIEREYDIDDIAISKGNSYSDFATNGLASLPGDDYVEPEEDEVEIYPHHFQVSRKIYFSGAQVAVSWYRAGGKNIYVDDDQMVFVPVGLGTEDLLMHTLPIPVSDEEREKASQWEMGITARYVLPIYQQHYGLPQGAWLKEVKDGSPAQEAGLQEGDILVGLDNLTILGDATLRKARAAFEPGQSKTLYFWRDGEYYSTELVRPEEL